jgi:uncharacterized protein (DUF885 family)
MRRALRVLPLLLAVAPWGLAQEKPKTAPWVAESDRNAQILLDTLAGFVPEQASLFGAESHDTEVLDIKPRLHERAQAANHKVLADLEARLAGEKEPHVRQDLEILVQAAKQQVEDEELENRYLLPYQDVPEVVYLGIQALLDDQASPARRARAIVRLKRYVGDEAGFQPITVLAQDSLKEALPNAALLGPGKEELEKNLGDDPRYVAGIGALFKKRGITGYEEPLAKLRTQVEAYHAFLKANLVPRVRKDFRLPPELYAFRLKQVGVDIPPAELADRAHITFAEIQNEMRALAPLVAKEKGLQAADYRDVIRALKRDQLVGEAILPHYKQRLRDIEEVIRREHVVTLPAREAVIRLSSDAEAAATPAPHLAIPHLVHNTGQVGEFVLPLQVAVTKPDGTTEMKSFDDFTFAAASWTLTVHEARPGHELQFDSIVEKGVSLARALFAFNSVNVEGWALYCEAEMKPYMPLDAQLISLQHRLMRAARAFLDPELQAGTIDPEGVVHLLMKEVVLSEPMARQEMERYMFTAPGQATSYFYGYTRWMSLRARTEIALGSRFNRQRYHDFILSQGLLPPDVLGRAIAEQFVPGEKATKE